MSQNGTEEKGCDHPRPWIKIVHRSGITIKDAQGAAVLQLPFTGLSSRDRKLRAAEMVLSSVNERAV